MKREMKSMATVACHYGEDKTQNYGAVVSPIYQNSLFTFKDWDAIDTAFSNADQEFIYTRGNNPSVKVVEEKLAKMADGERAKLFTSGMAAISTAIMYHAKCNGHIIAISNVYGPVNNFLSVYLKEKMNIEVSFISGKEIEAFKNAIQDNTCLIYLESPSSVVFSLQDLEAVGKLAKEHSIPTVIDNTWATPIFQKPLQLGIDMEVHSCTKYIGGHSDVVAGVIIGKEEDLKAICAREHAWLGGKVAPFEAWLIMRSLRTLHLRMKAHQESAMKVAKFLEGHSKVKHVYYPGLESYDQYELGKKQMSGYSGLLAIELACTKVEKIKAFVNHLEIFSIGVSWGGHESLVYVPAISYLKEFTPEQFKGLGISLGDVRLSIGLEDVEEIIEDLRCALDCL